MSTPRPVRFGLLTHPVAKIAGLAALFATAFCSYTWASDFPFFYHSDEESKALQLLEGYRNYWHPMLMLNATRLAIFLTGTGPDAQNITLLGRHLSAGFASTGVVCFAALAWVRSGFGAALLTSLFLLVLPLLFEVGHYCKEDPALFMGLGATLLAADRFVTIPNQRHIVWFGIAAGLGTSAKYPGVLLVVIGMPLVFFQCRRAFPVTLFLLAAALTVLAINYEWLTHLPSLSAGIGREATMLANGHDGVARSHFHTEHLRLLTQQIGWPMIGAAAAGVILCRPQGNRLSMEFVLGVSCLLILAGMSASAKLSERYLLPVMTVAAYLAACGVQALGKVVNERFRGTFVTSLAVIVAWQPGSLLKQSVADFRSDTRAEMSQWIAVHLKPEDKLATSLWTRLPGNYPGQFISGMAPPDYVADLGSVDQLKAMGYTWVATADVEVDRFSNMNATGAKAPEFMFQRRRHFYEELQTRSDLRWSRPRGVIYNLNPGLRLYQLRP